MNYTKLEDTLWKGEVPVKQAIRWLRNGDHPKDYSQPDFKENSYEGEVVRYFRHPSIDGRSLCPQCSNPTHDHGWIDQGGGFGVTVCPGDWVLELEVTESHRHEPQYIVLPHRSFILLYRPVDTDGNTLPWPAEAYFGKTIPVSPIPEARIARLKERMDRTEAETKPGIFRRHIYGDHPHFSFRDVVAKDPSSYVGDNADRPMDPLLKDPVAQSDEPSSNDSQQKGLGYRYAKENDHKGQG